MRLLLDSSYLFPAVEIDIVEGWSKHNLLSLIKSPHYSLFYCDLSLFEIYTKSLKLINIGEVSISEMDLQKGLQSIILSPQLHKLNWYDYMVDSDIVGQMKRVHSDSIDCAIFYLAVIMCETLATYDETMINHFMENPDLKAWISQVNPQFQYWIKKINLDP